MAYRTPLPYLQLLTLLLYTNRASAFGIEVHSKYPGYSQLNDAAQQTNPASDMPEQQVSSQTIFETIQMILSLTHRVLNKLNTTGRQLDMIQKLLAQQGGGESIFQPNQPFQSLMPNDLPEFPKGPDGPDYIWPKQPLSDLLPPTKRPRHPLLDLQPMTPLSQYKYPTTRRNYRIPPWRFRSPISRTRQPPIDIEKILASWAQSSNAHPKSSDQFGKFLHSPSGETRRYLRSYSHSKSQPSADPRLFVSRDNDGSSYDALYRPEIGAADILNSNLNVSE